MRRSIALMAGIALVAAACGSARAAAPPELLAAGDWSEPVADAAGYAVRGRLVLCERSVADDAAAAAAAGDQPQSPAEDRRRRRRREVIVYVELQDASDFVGRSMRLFCDFARADFRPESRGGGLRCALRDKDGRPVPPAPFPFGGGVPASEWVTLPSDATIRLRASPFGLHRAGAMALSPGLDKLWVIADGDPDEYLLSGTFSADAAGRALPPAGGRPPPAAAVGEGEHAWGGTIVLPAVRVTGRRGAATSRPNPATTQPGGARGR